MIVLCNSKHSFFFFFCEAEGNMGFLRGVRIETEVTWENAPILGAYCTQSTLNSRHIFKRKQALEKVLFLAQ